MELTKEWCGTPICENFEDGNTALSDRISKLKNHYMKKFNNTPMGYVRVPGRVNLIGEHIDYCGYPVCPMAIERDLLVAFGFSTEKDFFLHITNLDSSYPDHINKTDGIEVCKREVVWTSYLLSGILGVRNVETGGIRKEFKEVEGLCMAVSGNIPPAAGLSSSSALVVAGAIVYSLVRKLNFTSVRLADICALAETYVGTAGGGMDQAIILNATKGTSKLIEFNPLKLTDCILPEGALLVIANSMVTKNKATSSDFNTRAVECAILTQVLAKKLGHHQWKIQTVLHSLQKYYKCDLIKMKSYVDQYFHESPYTKDQVVEELSIGPSDLDHLSLSHNTYDVKTFKLKQRAMHVISEAERVYTWKKYCEEGRPLKDFGELMNASHDSLKNLYECSHPELDKLVNICRENGAYGARLTGAGWGGCIVALTTKEKFPAMKRALENYYSLKKDVDFDSAVFAVSPAAGAQVMIEKNRMKETDLL